MQCFSVKNRIKYPYIDFKGYFTNFDSTSDMSRSSIGFDYELSLDWDVESILSKIKSNFDRNMFLYGNVFFKKHATVTQYTPESSFLLEIDLLEVTQVKQGFDRSLPIAFKDTCAIFICYKDATCFKFKDEPVYILNDSGAPVCVPMKDIVLYKTGSSQTMQRQKESYVLSF